MMSNAHRIRSSFLHLPGINVLKERKLWADGIFDWADLIRATPVQLDLFGKKKDALHSTLEASEEALQQNDFRFFAERLPKREYYRVASTFPDKCIFLDIETTGLSKIYDSITLIGWSRDDLYAVQIDPQEITTLLEELASCSMLITFNGSTFDLPFLNSSFDFEWPPFFHIDLRYLCRRLKLTGGQKKVERSIGLSRDDPIDDITGAKAVALWFDYKKGDLKALRDLIRYNHADVEGMKFILERAAQRLAPSTPNYGSDNYIFERSRISFETACGHDIKNNIVIEPYRGAYGPRVTLNDLTGTLRELESTTIVGIDLTGSEKRKSGWARVVGGQLSMNLIRTDAELIEATLAAKPFLVSIDSPLSLPFGRNSEFDDDPEREQYGIVRMAERQLRKRGIHVYPALLPSMQRLTQRGVELAKYFRSVGIGVIECYPGAAQDILGIPRKQTSVSHLIDGLSQFGYKVSRDEEEVSHDELDAATSALVGQFMLAGYWEALGSVEEDYLIVPTVAARDASLGLGKVVGISGPISAGKTTAARYLEGEGFTYCRFSEVLQSEAEARGLPVTRKSLQELGKEVFESRFGQRRLQNALAARVGDARRVVVDGLRHPEDSAFLYERWGMAVVHIYVDASKDTRCQRYAAHYQMTEDEFRRAEMHEAEHNVPGLKALADHIVYNEGSVSELIAGVGRSLSG